ncbi:hypothetical protein [Ralstonia solanacearum]|uniref:hypothetical protein n=1 Tax=Ralstonia solanacearum TaxID=305 RepID=UPI00202A42F3|nr:hypothetical protein [Ralstonia solanacearum]MCL9847196.1 hypothetical protein [Ralstonia solanacearum]MDC6256315.1 hypothetical protein [Ralstonia solanacearum]MDC6261012.1 hypothetical protein [Ralstonia solanacearum]MDC6305573.1 hypothetical protein [Ralstonia solanacearum]
MRDTAQQFYATDKDVFDLLACAKRNLTDGVLREIARERGIFFSPLDTRDDLVEAISQLPFTLNELRDLIGRRESSRRAEKTTSVTLDADIAIDELKAVVQEYKEYVGISEKVVSHSKGVDGLVMNVEYDDMDYSRTRLIQRQRLDATIEFFQQGGKTVVRLPASEKSKRIVEDLTGRIESRRRAPIVREAIELDSGFTADERTMFFMRLISELPDHKLYGVTNLKIAPGLRPEEGLDEDDLDEDIREEASRELLVIVRSMALNGENLIASKEYRSLKERGFYITSITWKTRVTTIPYDIPHLHAEFEDGENGKSFKYSVKGTYRFQEGDYTKTARPVDDEERAYLYQLVESTARKILIDMRSKQAVVVSAEVT